MPNPIPVLIEVSRFFTTAEIASRSPDLILPVVTRLLISSSMASHRFVAFNSGKIFSTPKMSPRFISAYRIHFALIAGAFQDQTIQLFHLPQNFHHKIPDIRRKTTPVSEHAWPSAASK